MRVTGLLILNSSQTSECKPSERAPGKFLLRFLRITAMNRLVFAGHSAGSIRIVVG